MNFKSLALTLYSIIVGSLFIFIVVIVSYSIVKTTTERHLAGEDSYGLPTYNGPCVGLVDKTNQTFIESQKFSSIIFSSKATQKTAWDDLRNHHLIDAFALGQFCEDGEAEGRLLYLASAIEFTGMSNGLVSFREGYGITQNYYEEAEQLGYNKNHPREAAWLKNRIDRMAFRIKVRHIK